MSERAGSVIEPGATPGGEVAMPGAVDPDAQVQLAMYRTMSTIKCCDERLRDLISKGQIFIFYYSPRGQEAIPAAVSACLTPEDYVTTTYRGLHDEIAKGAPLGALLAEMFGRRAGTCKGKGGPMHISDPTVGLMVTTGIVGGGLPIANGLALASKLRGDTRVTVSYFGDGATNIGAFHEALNLAAVWELPVVFVCQNNEFGEFTPRTDTQRIERIADRAASYGIAGVAVDGNDPVATYRAARAAIDRARAGGGPTLLECTTYRFMGHFFGDPMQYMDAEALGAAVAADPVGRFRTRLLDDGIATDLELTTVEEHIRAEVDDAVAFALGCAPPGPEELLDDVYAERVPG